MEKEIVFIKVNKIHSKKNNKDYYTVQYLDGETLNYYSEFIDEKLYNKLNTNDFEALETYVATYSINSFRKIVLTDIN